MPTIGLSTAPGTRTHDLIAWIEAELLRRGQRVLSIESLPSAASFRSFLRVRGDDGSCIAMDAPPERENNPQFVRLSAFFGAHGIPVPAVLACDLDRGFLLVSDLGDRHLAQIYGTPAQTPAIDAALHGLIRIQSLPRSELIPPYTEQRMRDEFELFPEWLLRGLLGIEPPAPVRALLDATRDRLIGVMAAQPNCCVHRDYHCQNLLWREPEGLGIVDFQDALWGPIGYDLASLLRDCYHRFSEPEIEHWRHRYRELATAAGLPCSHDDAALSRELDWTALQRQIKAIGIFARLERRDGRARHLGDIVPVIDQIIDVAARYPAHRSFADWMATSVRPAAADALRKP